MNHHASSIHSPPALLWKSSLGIPKFQPSKRRSQEKSHPISPLPFLKWRTVKQASSSFLYTRDTHSIELDSRSQIQFVYGRVGARAERRVLGPRSTTSKLSDVRDEHGNAITPASIKTECEFAPLFGYPDVFCPIHIIKDGCSRNLSPRAEAFDISIAREFARHHSRQNQVNRKE